MTNQKARITELLLELQGIVGAPGAEQRCSEILGILRQDRFSNALGNTPELRDWLDRLIRKIAETYGKMDES